MEWFKHKTNAHDDPVVSDAWDEFGDAGYLIWFILLELYGQNFKIEEPDKKLHVSKTFISRKFRKRWTKVEQVLNYYATMGKLNLSVDTKTVTIQIPKFQVILSNWTKRMVNQPTEAPTEAPTAKSKSKNKNRDRKPPSKDGVCPHGKIIDLYHKILPELGQVQIWTKERQGFLNARWDEKFQGESGRVSNTLEFWEGYFQLVRECDWLMGRVPGRNGQSFKANLEWLVRPTNFAKTVEQSYNRD